MMTETTSLPQPIALEDLLAASTATEPYKDAVRALANGEPQQAIGARGMAPPVKLLRVVQKLLEARPELAIERADIDGRSACSSFVGEARVAPGGLTVRFNWDCRRQDERLGWTDYFGDADQGRAAREYGYQCFVQFEVID
jgi:hypothetical protein